LVYFTTVEVISIEKGVNEEKRIVKNLGKGSHGLHEDIVQALSQRMMIPNKSDLLPAH
jgi:hypothetical protein